MVITGENFKYLYKCASFILHIKFKYSNCRNIQAAHSVPANTAGKTTSIDVKKKKKNALDCVNCDAVSLLSPADQRHLKPGV